MNLTDERGRVLDIARLMWKRKLSVLALTGLGVAAGLVAGVVLPERYRASTLILVESAKVPESYVRTTVTSSVEERLRTIQQQTTNRESLERVIRDLDLYPELRPRLPLEDLVTKVRRSLQVTVERGAAFRISFSGSDPDTVARVANHVAQSFIEANLRVREGQALRTAEFLETELLDLQRQLEEHEARIASFRIRHQGELPEQRQSNLAAIKQLQERLDQNRAKLDALEIQRLLLEREMRLASDVPAAGKRMPSRLQELRQQLAEARSRFTDRHPDVIRLQREIEAVEEQQADSGPTVVIQPSGVDPVLLVRLEGLDREFERLQEERAELLGEIAVYQRRLETTPRIEQELLSLNRDYDNIDATYQRLLSKRYEARLAQKLEESEQGEQFRILERAIPPLQPYWPNRGLCLLVGLLAGLALGAGAALLREETDQTFSDREALRRAFPGVAVLATIPRLTPESRREKRSRIRKSA